MFAERRRTAEVFHFIRGQGEGRVGRTRLPGAWFMGTVNSGGSRVVKGLLVMEVIACRTCGEAVGWAEQVSIAARSHEPILKLLELSLSH